MKQKAAIQERTIVSIPTFYCVYYAFLKLLSLLLWFVKQ